MLAQIATSQKLKHWGSTVVFRGFRGSASNRTLCAVMPLATGSVDFREKISRPMESTDVRLLRKMFHSQSTHITQGQHFFLLNYSAFP